MGLDLYFVKRVADTLRVYTLEEAVQLAKAEKFENVYSVNGRSGAYLRTRPNIFAVARMRALIDEWRRFVDLSQRPEIIATLYHLPYKKPHADPRPNDRGLQIVKEFYPLAKNWIQ